MTCYKLVTIEFKWFGLQTKVEEHNLDASFSDAKSLLEKCVTLTYPNPANPLALSCDASDKAVGAVLEELQGGAWRPLGFWSKHLPPAKQNEVHYLLTFL